MLQRISIGLCLTFAASLPFGAAVKAADENHIETRFGEIRIYQTGDNLFHPDIVLFEGDVIQNVTDAIAWIEKIIKYSDSVDVVLIGLSSGGVACPAMFALVGVSKGAAQHLGTFGTCSDTIKEFRRVGSTLEFDIPSFSPELSHVTAMFDGRRVTEIEVRKSDYGAAPAGSGDDVTRWIGRAPGALFDEASERLRFKQIMTNEELSDLTAFVAVGFVDGPSSVERDGDYVIGFGMAPHTGGAYAGAWAIRISDGQPFAVIRRHDASPRVLGGPLSELPIRLREFALNER